MAAGYHLRTIPTDGDPEDQPETFHDVENAIREAPAFAARNHVSVAVVNERGAMVCPVVQYREPTIEAVLEGREP